MTGERRRHERKACKISILWKRTAPVRLAAGVVTNLSLGGCFVTTRMGPARGERVSVELNLPSILRLSLMGEVVYSLEKGFAIQFIEMDGNQQALLQLLLKRVELVSPV